MTFHENTGLKHFNVKSQVVARTSIQMHRIHTINDRTPKRCSRRSHSRFIQTDPDAHPKKSFADAGRRLHLMLYPPTQPNIIKRVRV